MTISTSAASSELRYRRGFFYAFGLMVPGIVAVSGTAGRHRSYSRKVGRLAILFLLVLCMMSCGGGSNGGTSGNGTTGVQSTGAVTYAVTVTGTSGAIVNSTTVGLVVE